MKTANHLLKKCTVIHEYEALVNIHDFLGVKVPVVHKYAFVHPEENPQEILLIQFNPDGLAFIVGSFESETLAEEFHRFMQVFQKCAQAEGARGAWTYVDVDGNPDVEDPTEDYLVSIVPGPVDTNWDGTFVVCGAFYDGSWRYSCIQDLAGEPIADDYYVYAYRDLPQAAPKPNK